MGGCSVVRFACYYVPEAFLAAACYEGYEGCLSFEGVDVFPDGVSVYLLLVLDPAAVPASDVGDSGDDALICHLLCTYYG